MPVPFAKVRSSLVLFLGYMLSPLSWWNDVVFNLPIAYGVGFLFSLISKDWFLPFTVIGYWLSNVAGMVMMQMGASDLLQKEEAPPNRLKQMALGFLSATLYTLVIGVLIKVKILATPAF